MLFPHNKTIVLSVVSTLHGTTSTEIKQNNLCQINFVWTEAEKDN